MRKITFNASLLAILCNNVNSEALFQQSPPIFHPTGVHYELADVKHALTVLQSIGVSTDALCHDFLEDYDSVLPRCCSTFTNRRQMLSSEQFGDFDDAVEVEETSHWFYIFNSLMVFLCVSTGALAAGLTIGLLSMDPLDLRITEVAGSTPKIKAQAKSLLLIKQNHHRLLVTLVLMNAIANESMPLFLNEILPEYMAIIVSVTLVLFFGEIIPTAIFTGPKKVSIATKFTVAVRLFLLLLAPLAIPIAKVLDVWMHDEDADVGGATKYNRRELSALVRIQYEEHVAAMNRKGLEAPPLHEQLLTDVTATAHEIKVSFFDPFSLVHCVKYDDKLFLPSPLSSFQENLPSPTPIHFDEVNMIVSALRMTTSTAKDAMSKWNDVYALPKDMVLNMTNVGEIYRQGFSRVPVHAVRSCEEVLPDARGETRVICGIFCVRELIALNPTEDCSLSTFALRRPHCVDPETNLLDLMKVLQSSLLGGSNRFCEMAIVCSNPTIANEALNRNEPVPFNAGVMGIVTLEDVLRDFMKEVVYSEANKKDFMSAEHRSQQLIRSKSLADGQIDNLVGPGGGQRVNGLPVASDPSYIPPQIVSREDHNHV